MIIVYAATSIVGGAAATALASQQNLLLGLLAAPIGGSLSVLAVALILLCRPARREALPSRIVWC